MQARLLASGWHLVSSLFSNPERSIDSVVALDNLTNPPPKEAPEAELRALKEDMLRTTEAIRSKKSALTVHDLRRLLYRCAAALISLKEPDHELLHHLVAVPFAVATPTAASAAVEVWTWLIAESPDVEVALMGEILSAWNDSILHAQGFFHAGLSYALLYMSTLPYANPIVQLSRSILQPNYIQSYE